jgi:hypothetical protein
MKTKATDKFPEIEWEITDDILDKDYDELMWVFLAEGKSKDGRKWSGSAYYFCDEFEEIRDIEENN